MKIKKLLKNLDSYTYIKIFDDAGSNGWEVIWEGDAYDCPWHFAEDSIDTDDIAEGLYINTIKDGSPCLYIYRKRED